MLPPGEARAGAGTDSSAESVEYKGREKDSVIFLNCSIGGEQNRTPVITTRDLIAPANTICTQPWNRKEACCYKQRVWQVGQNWFSAVLALANPDPAGCKQEPGSRQIKTDGMEDRKIPREEMAGGTAVQTAAVLPSQAAQQGIDPSRKAQAYDI